MARTAVDTGKAFLESVLSKSKLTPEQRAAVLADDTLLAEVGDGTLMRSEASRLTDDITARVTKIQQVETAQNEWWTTNKERLGRLEALEKNPPVTPAAGTGGIDEKVVDEKLARAMGEIESSGLYVTAVASEISTGHYAEFGERLDMRKLFTDAVKAKKPLDVFYNDTVAERRQTRLTEARAKELADVRAAGVKEGIAQAMNRDAQPYPVGGPQGISTLSGLRKPTDQTAADEYSLDAAVKTATEVMANAG